MVGAAAVGAGAVAALAAPASEALASPGAAAVKGAVQPTRSIVVHLGIAPPSNIDLTIKTVQSVLNQVGCGGCFSGWDITFTHEMEFFVSPTAGVQPGI